MNNDDFKEVPDNIQDNNEETTNNIDNTKVIINTFINHLISELSFLAFILFLHK